MDASFSQQGQYAVVINDEDQYSVWQQDQELPLGWRRDGFTGSRESCLTYIDAAWTDMTPRSVRRWLESRQARGDVLTD